MSTTAPGAEVPPPRLVDGDRPCGRGRRPVLLLFLVALFTSCLVQSGDPGIDTRRRLQVARSLWTDEPPVRAGEYPGFGLKGRDGRVHTWYGIGQSLVLLPGDIAATLVTRALAPRSAVAERLRVSLVVYLTFPLLAALGVLAAYALLRELGFRRRHAAAGALALLFCTSFLPYAQDPQENSLLFLLTASGACFHLRWLRTGAIRHLVFGALLLGFAVLSRLPSLLDITAVGALTLGLAWSRRGEGEGAFRRRLVRYALVCAPITLAFLLVDRWYHWERFGTFWGTYIHLFGEKARAADPSLPASFPFSGSFLQGFGGAFFSANKSVFLFDPLLLGSAGLVLYRWRKQATSRRAFAVVTACLLLAYAAFYATYYDWGGDSAWGDRFLTVPVQALALLALPVALEAWPELPRAARGATLALVVVAALVQLLSVGLWYELEMCQATSRGESLFVIGQRVENLVALLAGKFHAWGLACPGISPRYTAPNFLPFLATAHLSRGAALALQGAWFAGVGVVVALLWWLRRALRDDAPAPGGEEPLPAPIPPGLSER